MTLPQRLQLLLRERVQLLAHVLAVRAAVEDLAEKPPHQQPHCALACEPPRLDVEELLGVDGTGRRAVADARHVVREDFEHRVAVGLGRTAQEEVAVLLMGVCTARAVPDARHAVVHGPRASPERRLEEQVAARVGGGVVLHRVEVDVLVDPADGEAVELAARAAPFEQRVDVALHDASACHQAEACHCCVALHERPLCGEDARLRSPAVQGGVAHDRARARQNFDGGQGGEFARARAVLLDDGQAAVGTCHDECMRRRERARCRELARDPHWRGALGPCRGFDENAAAQEGVVERRQAAVPDGDSVAEPGEGACLRFPEVRQRQPRGRVAAGGGRAVALEERCGGRGGRRRRRGEAGKVEAGFADVLPGAVEPG